MQSLSLATEAVRPSLWQSSPIRRLADTDREQVREHLLALPAGERHSRFGMEVDAAWIDAWTDCLDFEREAVIGVMLHGILIGLAHVDGAGHAGVSVLAPWRGKGVAHALLTAAWMQVEQRGLGSQGSVWQ